MIVSDIRTKALFLPSVVHDLLYSVHSVTQRLKQENWLLESAQWISFSIYE